MNIIIEGNDGVGKSTLVDMLKLLTYDNVMDRGILTKMTDDDTLPFNEDDLYIILDAPVEVSHARLKACGKPMDEYYHTIESLTKYRARYKEIAEKLKDKCVVIDATKTKLEVARIAISAIESRSSYERFKTEQETSTIKRNSFFSWVAEVCIELGWEIERGGKLVRDPNWYHCYEDGLSAKQAVAEAKEKLIVESID